MKMIVVVALALVAVVVAAPVDQPLEKEPTKILKSEYRQNPDGGYTFEFETSDGTLRQETGTVVEFTDDEKKVQKELNVIGNYSYKNKDGTPETIAYSADRNGFRAEGPSVPKAPVYESSQ